MSATIRIPGPLRRADLDDLPQDGRRFELIDGALLVSPAPRGRHQRVIARLTYELEGWSRVHGGATYPGVNVDLDQRTHLEPDVAWSSDESDIGLAFTGTPELVVEVSDGVSPERSEESLVACSPSTRAFDRGIKRAAYLSSGAVEVWLVDLDADVVERHTADAASPAVHARGEDVITPLLPGFRVGVSDLLGPAGT